jgi:hypothetical protein
MTTLDLECPKTLLAMNLETQDDYYYRDLESMRLARQAGDTAAVSFFNKSSDHRLGRVLYMLDEFKSKFGKNYVLRSCSCKYAPK